MGSAELRSETKDLEYDSKYSSRLVSNVTPTTPRLKTCQSDIASCRKKDDTVLEWKLTPKVQTVHSGKEVISSCENIV